MRISGKSQCPVFFISYSEFEIDSNIYKSDIDEISSSTYYNKDFVISSDPKPLYLIGKFCQESPKYYKNGLKAIDLYIKLMNEKKAERLSKHFRTAITKAKFSKIKLHFKNRDFSLVKAGLESIVFDMVELGLRNEEKECKNIWLELKEINLSEWRKD